MQLDPPPPPDVALDAGTPVRVGRFDFEVRFTPGHSPGSVSFVGHDMVFGGDVLFNGSVGRTDLPGGDYRHADGHASSPSSSRSRTRRWCTAATAPTPPSASSG